MRYEVEQKYRAADHDEIARRLQELGFQSAATVTQVDTYYAHPHRNFAETDEALRISRVNNENFITYKGPKIDATTKTRREIELSIASGAEGAERCDEIWRALSFTLVREVTKTRQIYRVSQAKHEIEIAVDSVKNLGNFVELEIVIDEQSELDAAREAVAALAEELGLKDIERRSYLELLLDE